MDVLADVLEVTELANHILGQAELRAPWGIQIDPSTEATVHVIQAGSCWFRVEDHDPVLLEEGDIVLMARGNRHVIADRPDRAPRPLAWVLADMQRRRGEPETGPVTHVLCAKYRFGLPEMHPLITRLPTLLHLRAAQVARSARLQALISLLKAECDAAGAGTELVVPRLVDTLMVMVLRTWLETDGAATGSWFSALRDPGISRALGLIHRHPRQDWTVASLAEGAGQSRATFARRFAALVGETPVAYLARWRLCLAAKQLRLGVTTIEQAAFDAGYDSTPAFTRAFKRHYGLPPSQFRSDHRASTRIDRHGAPGVGTASV